MNIPKAIEILKVIGTNKDIYSVTESKEARQLGIEALGQFVILRKVIPYLKHKLLPSETPE